MIVQKRLFFRFAIASALVLGLVLTLVWAMVLREGAMRTLDNEYEVFRASSAWLEAYDATGLPPPDDKVLGFGVYDEGGSAIFRSGSAPEVLLAPIVQAESVYDAARRSLVFQRILGPAGMMGMRGMRNMGRRAQGLGEGQWQAPAEAAGQRRAVWMEYGIGDVVRQRTLLIGSAILATIGLFALYLVLLRLYSRNAELRSAEARNREFVQLGEAARTLVHEIKNPLGIIRIQAASLKRLEGAGAAEKAAARAELIEDEVLRLASLADRIREFLKGGEGEPRDLELGPWLRDFCARYDGSSPEGVAIGAIPTDARVRIDPERLGLALDNLVRNADEAASGSVAIEVARRGKNWEIRVCDRGPGVSTENQARLFEPFFTTKEQGSGIGLALARRVARSAGGELEYRAREGGGAVFALSLPARKTRTVL
ncbi:MAG: HAMP domain-containing sensor histidine kinase [Spirochaetaceae bacterium]|nr:HAMP domain-containing sensor histidine kinase [Spirochaetaceae bacterium]